MTQNFFVRWVELDTDGIAMYTTGVTRLEQLVALTESLVAELDEDGKKDSVVMARRAVKELRRGDWPQAVFALRALGVIVYKEQFSILDEGVRAVATLDRIRHALANAPECDKHDDDDVIVCGWKRDMQAVRAILDGSDA